MVSKKATRSRLAIQRLRSAGGDAERLADQVTGQLDAFLRQILRVS